MNGGGDGGDGGGGGAHGEGGESGPAGGVRYLCQVPDGAVKEGAAGGEHGAARLPLPPSIGNGTPPGEAAGSLADVAGSSSLAVAGSAAGAVAATDDAAAGPALHRPRQCYTCKARFVSLHHFYASLCPKCAALNFRMRHASQRRTTHGPHAAERALAAHSAAPGGLDGGAVPL